MDHDSHQAPAADVADTDGSNDGQVARRGFITQVAAAVIGAIVGIVPFVTGLLFFLDPLWRKGGKAKFIKMQITADALPVDGTPQMFKVLDDVTDAWNKFLNVEIGSVWLRKTKDGKVVAFTSICPHLGCAVDFRKANQDFYCPCHTSTFSLDGEKKNPIPPRNMDALELEQRGPEDNEIWIKYENFRATIPAKEPIT